MFGRREKLAEWLDASGAAAGLLRARRLMRAPWLTVLTYHRVARTHTEADRLDGGVVDATPAQLDRQLALVAQHFRVITTEDLAAWATEGAPLPRNPALVTFDDGYRDCHDEILPLLVKHGLRAVFFLATDYMTRRRVFWWDRIAYLFDRTEEREIALRYPMDVVLGADAKARALGLVKTCYGLDLDRYLDHLSEATRVDWSPRLERELADRHVMTWEHARALAAAGMDLESHTRTHRVLSTLAPRALDEELQGAREDIARETGRSARSIAYPVGRRVAGDDLLRDALLRAGYVTGFTNATRPTRLGPRTDLLDLGRMAMDLALPDAFFRSMMAVPAMAHVTP